jgi:hypothetical protein
MDWPTFFATVIKALAWPAVLVFFGHLLQKELRALINRLATRIIKLKGMGFETEFAADVGKVVTALPEEEQQKVEAASPTSSTDLIPTVLIDGFPMSVKVHEAWNRVYTALLETVDCYEAEKAYGPIARVRAALKQKLISVAEYKAIAEMLRISTQASNGVYEGADPEDIKRLIHVADIIAESIIARFSQQQAEKDSAIAQHSTP